MAVQKVKLSARQILDETLDVSDAVYSTLCEWSSKVIARNLAHVDRAKYSIFKNDAEQAKFLKNLASRFRIYLKKESYITDEEKNKVVEDMIALYTRVADKFGSLPAVDTSSRFMTYAGDIQSDDFPEYSVSYKTMHQMEAVAETLAIKMGIIPDMRYKTPKEVEDFSHQLATKKDVEDYNLREHDYQFQRAFSMLPYNMRALNDSNTFAKYLFTFCTYIGHLDDEDYKAFLELAKKIYKIGRA